MWIFLLLLLFSFLLITTLVETGEVKPTSLNYDRLRCFRGQFHCTIQIDPWKIYYKSSPPTTEYFFGIYANFHIKLSHQSVHKIDGYNTSNKYSINRVFAHSFPFGNSQLQSDNMISTTNFIVMKISN